MFRAESHYNVNQVVIQHSMNQTLYKDKHYRESEKYDFMAVSEKVPVQDKTCTSLIMMSDIKQSYIIKVFDRLFL